jgi:hypothetical protein
MKEIEGVVKLVGGGVGVRALLGVEVCAAGDVGEAPVLDFVASTAALDRYCEVIEPAGWRLESYRQNPVFQNSHQYGDIMFTLGKALRTEVRTEGGKPALCQRVEFAVEVNPVARVAYGLYKGGFLRAVSVGFVPVRWEDGGDDAALVEGCKPPRRRYLEQELLEVSAVAIPANPEALILGMRSGAVGVDAVREALEALRSVMGGAGPGGAGGAAVVELAREFGRAMRGA